MNFSMVAGIRCVDRLQALQDSIVMNFRKTQPRKLSGELFLSDFDSGVGLYYQHQSTWGFSSNWDVKLKIRNLFFLSKIGYFKSSITEIGFLFISDFVLKIFNTLSIYILIVQRCQWVQFNKHTPRIGM